MKTFELLLIGAIAATNATMLFTEAEAETE